MLLLQAKQQVAPLLHGAQALGVRLDFAHVSAGRLRQLGRAGKRRVQQLLPFAKRGIDAEQTCQDLLRFAESHRVHGLFQLARQAPQLLGVREPLCRVVNSVSRCSSSLRRACASRTATRSTSASAYASSISRCASGRSKDCVSCWPCKSTSSAPISASTPMVVGEPFTQARDLPSRSTSRFRTKRPSSSSIPSAAKGGSR